MKIPDAYPRSVTKSILDINSIISALSGRVLIQDVHKAQYQMLDYYARTMLINRFRGKRYNPDYPPLSPKYLKQKRKKYGVTPTLVATGAMRNRVIQSRPFMTTRGPVLRLRTMWYSRFLKPRFNFVSPKLTSERKLLSKYFKSRLTNIRRKRQTRHK